MRTGIKPQKELLLNTRLIQLKNKILVILQIKLVYKSVYFIYFNTKLYVTIIIILNRNLC